MMEGKILSLVPPPMMMMVALFCIIFQSYFLKALGVSSVVLSVNKNDYTGRRAYTTDIRIGNSHESFEFHIDSGNHLTWVQCDGSNGPREHLYKPPDGSIVECQDPICSALLGDDHVCPDPTARCEYDFDFGDGKSTEGYLVKDIFSLQLIDESIIHPLLVFGCGYKQTGDFKGNGLLGLGRGGVSLLSQMHSQNLIDKVTGHCLNSGEEGGFLFLGNDLVPPSGVSWTPILEEYDNRKKYLSGSMDFLFNGKTSLGYNLPFEFNSGVSLSYLNSGTYEATLHMIKLILVRTQLRLTEPVDNFSICWKHNRQPISSLDDVIRFFKKLTLEFKYPHSLSIHMLEIPAKNFLVLRGEKVCLGILDGDQSDVEYPNIIGVNFMQDKLVIYDSANSRIGWTSTRSCHMPSRV